MRTVLKEEEWDRTGLRFIRKWADGWRLHLQLLTVNVSHLWSRSVGRGLILLINHLYLMSFK